MRGIGIAGAGTRTTPSPTRLVLSRPPVAGNYVLISSLSAYLRTHIMHMQQCSDDSRKYHCMTPAGRVHGFGISKNSGSFRDGRDGSTDTDGGHVLPFTLQCQAPIPRCQLVHKGCCSEPQRRYGCSVPSQVEGRMCASGRECKHWKIARSMIAKLHLMIRVVHCQQSIPSQRSKLLACRSSAWSKRWGQKIWGSYLQERLSVRQVDSLC